jgi:hypothetical protein
MRLRCPLSAKSGHWLHQSCLYFTLSKSFSCQLSAIAPSLHQLDIIQLPAPIEGGGLGPLEPENEEELPAFFGRDPVGLFPLVSALFHEIHQLGAIKIPNKHRLKIARYAHLNCLSALWKEHLNIAGFRASSSASAEMKRRTNHTPG